MEVVRKQHLSLCEVNTKRLLQAKYMLPGDCD